MRRTIAIVAALIAALALAACGGSGGNATGSGGSETGAVTEGGILRVGTINYIDSFNPFHYIEGQSFNAFIMLYPQLVQYDFENGEYVIVGDLADSWDTSADGKDWTFHLKSGDEVVGRAAPHRRGRRPGRRTRRPSTRAAQPPSWLPRSRI